MKTLRKGDKGDDVVALQHLLNVEGHKITIDGEFGPRTETVVKMFQEVHDLEADGIVGPKTWAALGVKSATTSNSKCVDPSVVYMPLNVHVTKSKGRTIKYLAIHYTAGGSSAPGRAKGVKKVFEARRASADFAVDDRDMVQFNPDLKNYYCWAVGDPKTGVVKCLDGANRNTISIEICSNLKPGTSAAVPNHEGWYFTEAALNNAARLAKILMKKYNIPIERVVRHYDISGKICPGVPGWTTGRLFTTKGERTSKYSNEDAWLAFKARLK